MALGGLRERNLIADPAIRPTISDKSPRSSQQPGRQASGAFPDYLYLRFRYVCYVCLAESSITSHVTKAETNLPRIYNLIA